MVEPGSTKVWPMIAGATDPGPQYHGVGWFRAPGGYRFEAFNKIGRVAGDGMARHKKLSNSKSRKCS